MSKKKSNDNPYVHVAKQYMQGNSIGLIGEIELAGIQALSVLALAEEQRTANLIAYFRLLPADEESEQVESMIRERLGFNE